jgi:glutamine---fructose-6-phosphate transaminase (isomerizing)
VTSDAPGALMRAEIAEQPQRWLELVQRRSALDAAAALVTGRTPSSLVYAARGSSDHAALYAQYLTQSLLGVPAALATPSVSTMFGRDVFTSDMCVVAVSQSGASPDLVATLESARRRGAATVAFTNDAASPLAGLADVHVPLAAGPERSIAATKTYTAELLALNLWLRAVAGEPADATERSVAALAEHGREVIARSAELAQEVAVSMVHADRTMVIGRGYSVATAREAALKLMETCSLAASGWSAADAKHGPLASVTPGTPVFCLVAESTGRDSVDALVPDLQARGAQLHLVGSDPGAAGSLAGVLPAELDDALVPVVGIIPFQQLALELALLRGMDPDRPLGLSKVTRTT